MFQIQNKTPLPALLGLFTDSRGANIVGVAVKGTFVIRADDAMEPTPEQIPIHCQDVHYGEPADSSVRYPCDLVMGKNSTDVGLVGQAFSPNGEPVRELEVSLRVGPVHKRLVVFGDRVWDGGSPSKPELFTSMPLIYERAYGGSAPESPEFVAANPVGRGFFLNKRSASGQPVPNIEDPQRLISSWDDRPTPAGCGFIAPSWQPRRAYAGTYDDRWQEEQFPLLPADFDMRFFNCASPGLVCDGFLVGDEPVELINLSPRGPLRFRLPGIAIWIDALLRGQISRRKAEIWTVILEPEHNRYSVVWGCSIEVGSQPSRLTEITVSSSWLDSRARQRAA
jgi:hypothetical protein